MRASWFSQNFSESFLLDSLQAGEVLLPIGDVPELGTAINAFWHSPHRADVEYPAGGETKSAAAHIIDLPLDQVVVMGYRDSAGDSDSNGIIDLDEEEIAYASTIGKAGLVIAGLETKDLGDPLEEHVTFFEEGLSVLDSESQIVADHFASTAGFGGFSIHAYQDEFASGVTGWPELPPAPEMSVENSNNEIIADGDETPSVSSQTDFGLVAVTGGTAVAARRSLRVKRSRLPQSICAR